MNIEYWYMLPIATLIATIAMASGVEGGTFFAPIFMLALGLPPEVAIGAALITEVFGFSSGLFAYARKRLIDYRLGIVLLAATVPGALLGTWATAWISPDLLKIVFSIGLIAIAASFLRTSSHEETMPLSAIEVNNSSHVEQQQTCILTADGREIRYTINHRIPGQFVAGLGGMLIGLLSTGLGEVNGFYLLKHCRIPSQVAVATNVFIVAVTALVASCGHFVQFVQQGGETLETVLSLVSFTVPGVIIGGQLGPFIATRIPQQGLERGLAVLFTLVAAVTLGEYFLSNPPIVAQIE
ncbi:MAG TPA: sulfite exporter TauE/SafE family protein [Coleofasciculaceae cyanobacterium]